MSLKELMRRRMVLELKSEQEGVISDSCTYEFQASSAFIVETVVALTASTDLLLIGGIVAPSSLDEYCCFPGHQIF